MQLRVASYNIHRAIGNDGVYEPGRILRALCEMNADIVALQEIDLLEPGDLQLLPWLAARTCMVAIPGPVRSRGPCEYGNALLTRFPVMAVRRWDLSVGLHEARGALDVDLRVSGHSMQVVTTHLGLWPRERSVQTERLLKLFVANRHDVTILMGDFNEWQVQGKALQGLSRVFGATSAPATFPARCPLLPLDRIWMTPARALHRVAVHDTPLSRVASDHLPIKADIYLLQGSAPMTRSPMV
ncbi:MAG TPA: endonuclease/exonuclease/phosphatase family protein [Nitrospira sp.]|nr:endonuclease/exonuclease/phosphatase family protein [Nitrospira sp.]